VVPIAIEMVGEIYEADVTPWNFKPISWRSLGPMTGSDLIQKLLDLGYHQQDVVDAFCVADPTFVTKLNRGDFNSEQGSTSSDSR
jgi:hypothetical protein